MVGRELDMDLVLIRRLDLVAVRVIERDVDRDRVGQGLALRNDGQREGARFFLGEIGDAHGRAGGEDALADGRADRDLILGLVFKALRRHFDRGFFRRLCFAARILRADGQHALDNRRAVHALARLGEPAEECLTLDLRRFGQLADRRARQNGQCDKNVAVLVNEFYGDIEFKAGSRRFDRIRRGFRFDRLLGTCRGFRFNRLLGICRGLRICRLRRLCRGFGFDRGLRRRGDDRDLRLCGYNRGLRI